MDAPSFRAMAHGAAVCPIEGTRLVAPLVAQGAWVTASAPGRAVVEGGVTASGRGRACGPEVAWTVVGGEIAWGSRSKLNRDPKGKCCTTGNFDRTSALYILIMPWGLSQFMLTPLFNGRRKLTLLILPQPARIPEIS